MRQSIQAARLSRGQYVPLFPRLFVSALALAFFAAGLGLLAQHLTILRTWRPIEATVARAEVISFLSSGNKQRKMYRGEVVLAYQVEGQHYHTPDAFNTASTSEDSIRGQMETTYGVGTQHRIFYDPANPHSIRWNVGANPTFFLLPILFGGVGLILIGVCYWLWKLPLPPRRECSGCSRQLRPAERHCPQCGALGLLKPSHQALERAPISGDVEEDSKQGNPRLMLLLGVFFGLPGVACLIGAAYMGTANYSATETWPTVEATVSDSFLETTRSRDGTPIYRLGVVFDYDGVEHREYAAGQSIYVSGSYPWIVQRLARFAPGSRHRIRVNPQNKADIRFDLENPLLNWLPTAGVALFGTIFAAIGTGLLTAGARPRCNKCHRPISRQAIYCPACGQVRDWHRSVIDKNQ